MKTTPIRTSDLIGPALDWAVAKCEGNDYIFTVVGCGEFGRDSVTRHKRAYSSDWSLAGPIIERERIVYYFHDNHRANDDDEVHARYSRARHKPGGGTWDAHKCGPTLLIAAMRAFCASKLGDVIDIPEELCQ